MTEREIQRAFQRQCGFSGALLPNVHMPGTWTECDLLGITRVGYLYEWEIKTNRADFLRDFEKKPFKHLRLSGERDPGYRMMHPKHFWFIAPEDVVPVVPCYAGLIWVREEQKRYSFKTVVRAPKLPGQKCTFEQMSQLLGKACYKMWDVRRRLSESEEARAIYRSSAKRQREAAQQELMTCQHQQ